MNSLPPWIMGIPSLQVFKNRPTTICPRMVYRVSCLGQEIGLWDHWGLFQTYVLCSVRTSLIFLQQMFWKNQWIYQIGNNATYNNINFHFVKMCIFFISMPLISIWITNNIFKNLNENRLTQWNYYHLNHFIRDFKKYKAMCLIMHSNIQIRFSS